MHDAGVPPSAGPSYPQSTTAFDNVCQLAGSRRRAAVSTTGIIRVENDGSSWRRHVRIEKTTCRWSGGTFHCWLTAVRCITQLRLSQLGIYARLMRCRCTVDTAGDIDRSNSNWGQRPPGTRIYCMNSTTWTRQSAVPLLPELYKWRLVLPSSCWQFAEERIRQVRHDINLNARCASAACHAGAEWLAIDAGFSISACLQLLPVCPSRSSMRWSGLRPNFAQGPSFSFPAGR